MHPHRDTRSGLPTPARLPSSEGASEVEASSLAGLPGTVRTDRRSSTAPARPAGTSSRAGGGNGCRGIDEAGTDGNSRHRALGADSPSTRHPLEEGTGPGHVARDPGDSYSPHPGAAASAPVTARGRVTGDACARGTSSLSDVVCSRTGGGASGVAGPARRDKVAQSAGLRTIRDLTNHTTDSFVEELTGPWYMIAACTPDHFPGNRVPDVTWGIMKKAYKYPQMCIPCYQKLGKRRKKAEEKAERLGVKVPWETRWVPPPEPADLAAEQLAGCHLTPLKPDDREEPPSCLLWLLTTPSPMPGSSGPSALPREQRCSPPGGWLHTVYAARSVTAGAVPCLSERLSGPAGAVGTTRAASPPGSCPATAPPGERGGTGGEETEPAGEAGVVGPRVSQRRKSRGRPGRVTPTKRNDSPRGIAGAVSRGERTPGAAGRQVTQPPGQEGSPPGSGPEGEVSIWYETHAPRVKGWWRKRFTPGPLPLWESKDNPPRIRLEEPPGLFDPSAPSLPVDPSGPGRGPTGSTDGPGGTEGVRGSESSESAMDESSVGIAPALAKGQVTSTSSDGPVRETDPGTMYHDTGGGQRTKVVVPRTWEPPSGPDTLPSCEIRLNGREHPAPAVSGATASLAESVDTVPDEPGRADRALARAGKGNKSVHARRDALSPLARPPFRQKIVRYAGNPWDPVTLYYEDLGRPRTRTPPAPPGPHKNPPQVPVPVTEGDALPCTETGPVGEESERMETMSPASEQLIDVDAEEEVRTINLGPNPGLSVPDTGEAARVRRTSAPEWPARSATSPRMPGPLGQAGVNGEPVSGGFRPVGGYPWPGPYGWST